MGSPHLTPGALRHLLASCMLMGLRLLVSLRIHILDPHTPAPHQVRLALHLHTSRLRHTMRLLLANRPTILCIPQFLIPMPTQTVPPHALLRHKIRMHQALALQCHSLRQDPHPDPVSQLRRRIRRHRTGAPRIVAPLFSSSR